MVAAGVFSWRQIYDPPRRRQKASRAIFVLSCSMITVSPSNRLWPRLNGKSTRIGGKKCCCKKVSTEWIGPRTRKYELPDVGSSSRLKKKQATTSQYTDQTPGVASSR